jgi:iron complex transport system substrate-binding protein
MRDLAMTSQKSDRTKSSFKFGCLTIGMLVLLGLLFSTILSDLFNSLIQKTNPELRDNTQKEKIRIVSLAPNMTEMLFLIGAGDCVVGATDYCDYPPEARQIERVGGLGAPNMEKVLSLAPDLVVATDIERPDVAAALRRMNIRVFEHDIHNIEEMFSVLKLLGEVANRNQEAQDAVARMRRELDDAVAQNRDVPPEKRPRVFVEILDDPLMTAGAASFLDDVIVRAGGVNLAHDFPEAYPRISAEKVIEWNPDVILVAHTTQGGDPAERMAERIGWAELAAVKNGRVIRDIPADLLLRPGPRLIEGIKALAQRLHGVDRQTPPP